MNPSRNSEAPPPPVPTGTVTISVVTASKTHSPFAEQAPPPPTGDPEAVLRSRYGGLLPAHKKKGPSLKGGHLHQHFDSADWSMAKARMTTTGSSNGASSLLSAAPLPSSSTLDVAPPKLAPEPPAPRRASHLGEASK